MKGFFRVASAVPPVRPGDIVGNVDAIKTFITKAHSKGACLVVFPELAITGTTCGDAFFMPEFLASAEEALHALAEYSRTLPSIAIVVGLPLRVSGRLFNCAAIVSAGSLVGVVPKCILKDIGADADSRFFASLVGELPRFIECAHFANVPFGSDLVFKAGSARIAVEIGSEALLSGDALPEANIIACPFAEGEILGASLKRRSAVTVRSRQLTAAYVLSGAGVGESSTDLAYAGPSLIAENGELLAEGDLFCRAGTLAAADVDTGYLQFARMRSAAMKAKMLTDSRVVDLALIESKASDDLLRPLDPLPFVPSDSAERDSVSRGALEIQASALATRLAAIGAKRVVIGISGGLDSALALLVAVKAFQVLGLDRSGIMAYTLPGFGTTQRTKGNAHLLCEQLSIPIETVDIAPVALRHLKDLGHDESLKDITYENAQARARTYFLMDKANQLGAILVGTGDLSELALGWCTFNGDHMSMYGVNAGVPKTLVRAIVEWGAKEFSEAGETLRDILATPVSPELLPAAADGTIAQETEDKVGPYELHDFFIYHHLQRGASGEKIKFLASHAFAGKYDGATVAKWLDVFFRRFKTQQFKRSCMPDGPKVVGVGFSPRGDFKMPSDMR